jgi:hypothetical protein
MFHQESSGKRMMEGLGGPVTMDDYSLAGIDPCLEDCCRREVCEIQRVDFGTFRSRTSHRFVSSTISSFWVYFVGVFE